MPAVLLSGAGDGQEGEAMRTGRPRGSVDHCRRCGLAGHRAINGMCALVVQAAEMVRNGASSTEAAKMVGVTKNAVNARLARERAIAQPKIEEHW